MSTIRDFYLGNIDVVVPKVKPDIGYNMEGSYVREPYNTFPFSVVGQHDYLVQNVVIENVNIVYLGAVDVK